jgi:serine/threonine-protein kinase
VAEDPQSDPLVGQTLLDKLEVIRKLGGGGMGAVYEVEHLITGHRRALKLIKPEYVKRRSFMRRLIREAGVAGKLQTPYVVETYDAGTMDNGSAYVLMELLDGEQLIDLLEREEVLSIPRLMGIMTQLCEGVSVAHASGIIHRDLKPENIFLVRHPSGNERVKILDFGISKFKDPKDQTSRLTQEGTILGTPFYMSPEQAAAKEVDERSDVYSVGVMLYEALAGRLPFDAKSVGALFIKIAAGEYLPLRVYRPDAPDELAAIVDKAMHRDRDQRYQSMEALRSALVPYAPGDTRIRAKTISDSPKPARATQAYEDVPRPPRTPKLDTMSMGVSKGEGGVGAVSEETVAADSEPPADEPRMPSIPAAAAAHDYLGTTPDPAPRVSRGTWVAAATIVGVAAAVAIGLAVSGGADEPVAPESVARTPEAVAGRHAREAREARADEERARSESEAAEPTEERAELQPAAEAAVPDEGVEAVAPSPERRVRPLERRVRPLERRAGETPAERAGLDPNPYGN